MEQLGQIIITRNDKVCCKCGECELRVPGIMKHIDEHGYFSVSNYPLNIDPKRNRINSAIQSCHLGALLINNDID